MKKFTPKRIKEIFKAIKVGKKIVIKGRQIKILSIKEANAGYDYAKVRIKMDKGKNQYLELYWEGPYFGIDLSEDIDEFQNFDFKNFRPPKTLKRKGKIYTLTDQGFSMVTESDGVGDYQKEDKVFYWEYFSGDKFSRISLGLNERSRKWLNMFAEKLKPNEINFV